MIEIGTAVWMGLGLGGVLTRVMLGAVFAAPKTVPCNCVIFGVLVLLNTTVKRPPEVVPSRLSVVFLAGATPPSLGASASNKFDRSSCHSLLKKLRSSGKASAPIAIWLSSA